MAKPNLTAERLREVLDFDPNTGIFTWRVDRKVGHSGGGQVMRLAGKTAGSRRSANGYLRICIDVKVYLAHRLAWFHTFGRWPEHQIDHMDGDRTNNRLANLRDVPHSVNGQNRRLPPKSKANKAPLGAHWKKAAKRWAASIGLNGKLTHLGYFDTAEDAHAAYLEAKRRLHEGCTI